MPDYFEKETSHWIVFPWEARETMAKIMQKAEGKRAISKEISNLVKAGLPKQLAEKLLKRWRQEPIMLYHIKEYGKYAEITGYRNMKFSRCRRVPERKPKENPANVDLQFFDADLIATQRAPVFRSPKRTASFPQQNKHFQKLSHGNNALRFRPTANTKSHPTLRHQTPNHKHGSHNNRRKPRLKFKRRCRKSAHASELSPMKPCWK